EGGRFLRFEGELFPNASWVAVMLGHNVIPRTIDPLVSSRPHAEIGQKLALLRQAMNGFADAAPTHEEVLRQYCASSAAGASTVTWRRRCAATRSPDPRRFPDLDIL